MITLYVKPNCPYSAKAIEALDRYSVEYTLKNIKDPDVARELLTLGGKRQVPFLEDDDPCDQAKPHTPCMLDEDVEMYESDHIVEYVESKYGHN